MINFNENAQRMPVIFVGHGSPMNAIESNPFTKMLDWAIESDTWFKEKLLKRDFSALTNDYHNSEAGKLSIRMMDHFFPMHYVLGASDSNDELIFEFEEIHNAAISMRTFGFWPKGTV